MEKIKVLGFGEVLWDKINNKLNIGGTVFNFIAHCKKMGAEAYLISAIGNDELGRKILDYLNKNGISRKLMKITNIPTCIVDVVFDKNSSPIYSLSEKTSWDFINVDDNDLYLINEIKFDYFCFGTLAQRGPINLRSLKTILSKCKLPQIFFDMNLRLNYYTKSKIEYSMKICDILKVNQEEIIKIKNLFGFKENNFKELANKIRGKYNIKILCITEGEVGAYTSSDNGFIFCPGYKVKVKDTVGAGDAFSAGFITQLHKGLSIKDACDYACKIGALVATSEGAVPDYSLADIDNFNGV